MTTHLSKAGRWAAFAALAIVAALALWQAATPPTPPIIGAPFTLTQHDGSKLSSAALAGKPFAVFFGFTYCPDICPTTLLDLSGVIGELGTAADGMRFLFVSIDPERDTPEQLRKYLASFDPHITGLTGSVEEIAAVAKAYRAHYVKVPTSDGYTMEHSTMTYLMDRSGRFTGIIRYQEARDKQVTKLRKLLGAR